jgi:hypothetical protein
VQYYNIFPDQPHEINFHLLDIEDGGLVVANVMFKEVES